MQKSSQAGASSQMVIIAIVIVLVLGGLIYYATKPKSATNPYGNGAAQTPPPSPAPTPTPAPATSSQTVTLALKAQNQSGETGTAKIYDENGVATVEVEMTGEPTGATQPMHIHLKSCADLGAVKYPLTNLVGGKSETKLTITTAQLLSQLPLAINVHKSAVAANVYVSCGDIQTSSAAQASPAPAPPTPPAGTTPAPTPPPASMNVKTFNVTETNYSIAPSQIRVKKGDTVKINVSITGGFHNLTVSGYGVGTESLNAGQSAVLQFVADKTGTFEYYCSVDSHRDKGMTGQLIVE
jgi:plastocyanin